MYRKALFVSCSLGIFWGFIHRVSIIYAWYQHPFMWWYDMPMHLCGGVVLGAAAFWFFGSFRLNERSPLNLSVETLSLIAVLFAGILWEIFEYQIGFAYNPMLGYIPDTVKDIVLDLGGAAAIILFYQRRRRSSSSVYEA